jgi:hypothetical protein|nr:MAG TPA_asm: tail tube protein [Caudoviricetes sp.]
MKTFDHNKVFRGSFGKVWLDDEKLANVKSFEAKVSLDYEEMDVNGDLGKKQRYMGYSVSGTMVMHKYDSTILKKYKEGIVTGELPELKIVSALDDPSAYGAERVALYDVTLDELALSKFENKGLVEEEVPFKAGSFELLDLV